MSVNFALGDCKAKIEEDNLPEKEYLESAARKEKAAHIMQSSRVLKNLGINTDIKLFKDIYYEATKKNLDLHEMTNADLKKFKWELQDRENWINEGYDGGGSAFKVLEANLKRIPGGKELYRNVTEIQAYHREHTRVNNNRIVDITNNVGKLAKNMVYLDPKTGKVTKGVDIKKLSELEADVQNAETQAQKNKALDNIKEFLGAINSEGARTAAGDLYLSIRDAMENTPIKDLRKTNEKGEKVPWNGEEQAQLKVIQDTWFSMRKDLVKVLKNALRSEKRIISETDRMESGSRRLTEYLDRIDQYIMNLELVETTNTTGRQYSISGKEKHEWGLQGKKEYELNTELGYMPHYVLTIVKDLQKFNDFAMDHTQTKSAFEVFSDQVRLWEGSQGVLDRVKSRQDINQEYYSRNPFLFLSKYMHEVSSYNYTNSLKEATQATLNMFIKYKREGKSLGDQDSVNKFVEQASDVINHIVESSLGKEMTQHSFSDKAARFMTGLSFIRTMGFNGRSAIRNSGQQLLERIRMGFYRRGQAADYLTDNEIFVQMNYEAKKHGILWTKDGAFLAKLQRAYAEGGQEGTKGSIEDRGLLPGLREVQGKDGKKTIEMYDESLSDKLLGVVEKVAQKGSVLHTMVENMNRFGTFKVGYATAHENLSKAPIWFIEQEMNRINTTPEQRSQWIANQAGKLAYHTVSDVHFEYGRIFKPKIFQEGAGAVLGQFQHYRFSLANLQYDIFKRGWRDIKSGDMGWSNEGAAQLYRMGTAYAVIGGLTSMFGLGFSNLLANDNYEFIKGKYKFLTAERDGDGNLTKEGLKQAEQATYGHGSWADFGPSVNLLIELGQIAHWWTVDMNSYIPMLQNSGQSEKTLEDEDRSYQLMRLANIQLARATHHTIPAMFNRNWTKMFYTETGLYTDYETTKQSIQFWDWARQVTGIPETGRSNKRIGPPKVRRKKGLRSGISRD